MGHRRVAMKTRLRCADGTFHAAGHTCDRRNGDLPDIGPAGLEPDQKSVGGSIPVTGSDTGSACGGARLKRIVSAE